MTASGNWQASALLAAAFIASGLASASAAGVAHWKLDTAKSRLGFSGTQTGAKFEGQFTRYTTEIAFDPNHLDASHITVTVDMASAATGDTQRDTALPDKDWFNAGRFPQARFETTVIRKVDADTYEAAGNLTLRDVTKPVTLSFTLQVDGNAAHAIGHANLARSGFGVGQGAWASDQWVAIDVGIDLDIVAAREN